MNEGERDSRDCGHTVKPSKANRLQRMRSLASCEAGTRPKSTTSQPVSTCAVNAASQASAKNKKQWLNTLVRSSPAPLRSVQTLNRAQ